MEEKKDAPNHSRVAGNNIVKYPPWEIFKNYNEMIFRNYSAETAEEFPPVGFDSIEEMQEEIRKPEYAGKVFVVLPDYYTDDDSDYDI